MCAASTTEHQTGYFCLPIYAMTRNGKQATREITVTEGNLRQRHLYLTGALDLFSTKSFGASSKLAGTGKLVRLEVVGLSDPIFTDIPVDHRTGRPRPIFRKRGWVRKFFNENRIRPGDRVSIERVETFHFRIAPKTIRRDRIAAEFFAGIGLVRMGLEKQGWSVAFANDIDEQKKALYEGHFGDTQERLSMANVHDVKPSDVPDVTLATASFPCTDLSLAGGRSGLKGEQSSAFWGFQRILEGMGKRRPPLVLLENVLGFLTSHDGRDFYGAMKSLNALGYAVDPFVLDARWFVPQSRPRVFVVASRIGGGHRLRVLDSVESRIRPRGLTSFMFAHSDIDWQVRDLPEPPHKSLKTLEDILDSPDDPSCEWWPRERAEYFLNQISENHRALAERMIDKRCWSHATAFRRVRQQSDGRKRSVAELRFDGVAGCLRTPKGGSGRQILFRAGYGKYFVRLLTPAECARLMGADNFRIVVSPNQALFGFGDAVCVPAIEWIARNYLNPVLEDHKVPRGQR